MYFALICISPFFIQIFSNYIAMAFRKAGAFAWVHVDDLIAAHDKATLHQIVKDVVNALVKSEIRINYKNSHLITTKKLSF